MDINVGITLVNNRGEEVTVRIPAGSIFEIVKTEYHVQNVAVIQDHQFKVPPYGQRKVVIRGRCLNPRRSLPRSSPGRATPFRYAGDSFDQNAIWQAVSAPRTI